MDDFIVPTEYTGPYCSFEYKPGKIIQIPSKYSDLVKNIGDLSDYVIPNLEGFEEDVIVLGCHSIYLLTELIDKINELETIYKKRTFNKNEDVMMWINSNFRKYEVIDYENSFLNYWQISSEKANKLMSGVFELAIFDNEIPYLTKEDIEVLYKRYIDEENYYIIKLLFVVYSPLNLAREEVRNYLFTESIINGFKVDYLDWMKSISGKSINYCCITEPIKKDMLHIAQWLYYTIRDGEDGEEYIEKLLPEWFIDAYINGSKEIIRWLNGFEVIKLETFNFIRLCKNSNLENVKLVYEYMERKGLEIEEVKVLQNIHEIDYEIIHWYMMNK